MPKKRSSLFGRCGGGGDEEGKFFYLSDDVQADGGEGLAVLVVGPALVLPGVRLDQLFSDGDQLFFSVTDG